MLKLPARRTDGRRLGLSAGRLALAVLAWSFVAVRALAAGATTQFVPILAQATKTAADPAAESSGGSWPILDWLIVAALIGGAVFAICRSSRRN